MKRMFILALALMLVLGSIALAQPSFDIPRGPGNNNAGGVGGGHGGPGGGGSGGSGGHGGPGGGGSDGSDDPGAPDIVFEGENKAFLSQFGLYNFASIVQSDGQFARVLQFGNGNDTFVNQAFDGGNSAFVYQAGSSVSIRNLASVLQIGAENRTDQVQFGDGNLAKSLQIGDGGHISQFQSGNYNKAYSNQFDDGNKAFIYQMDSHNFATTNQFGTDDFAKISQSGQWNTATINQFGEDDGNTAFSYQTGAKNNSLINQGGAVQTSGNMAFSSQAGDFNLNIINQSSNNNTATVWQAGTGNLGFVTQ